MAWDLGSYRETLDKKETSNLSQCLMAGKDQKITLLNDKQGREDNND